MTQTITTTDAKLLRQITADVQQLTHPIHLAVRGRVVTHPALLDQLRAAVAPGVMSGGSTRGRAPGSQPTADLGAVDALSTLYVELSGWRVRLGLASPADGDWQKAMLLVLADRAPDLAPEMLAWLAVEVRDWWSLAARASGWRPVDLLKIR
jgi:hypothetical protein